MYCTRRKRLQLSRVLFLISGLLICCVYQLTISARMSESWAASQMGEDPQVVQTDTLEAQTRTVEEVDLNTHSEVDELSGHTTPEALPFEMTSDTTTFMTTTEDTPSTTTKRIIVHCIYVDPAPPKPTEAPTPPPTSAVPNTTLSAPGDAPHIKGDYPQDLFTVEDRRRGWVILHISGMIYMFVSLAIVCDEFFVPALGVITDKLAISDDVAGATFMAAGGSAPELFTSLIGVFISHSNVGIGTIVGSAVFNILFVIGMCAVFSREMLHLTWWPLFRDVSFYIIDLIMLIIFFLDNTIMWWESVMLVCGYTSYVCFMKFNVQIERAFKSQLMKHKSIMKVIAIEEPDKNDVASVEENPPPEPDNKNRLKLKPALQRGGSSASLHNSTMRTTIFQLMIHTLDPLGEGKFKEKAEILNSMARGKDDEEAKGEGGSDSSDDSDDEDDDSEEDSDEDSEDEEEAEHDAVEDKEDNEDENDEPLSLEWPETPRKQATYLFLLPIIFPLWLTVPDVRNPKSKKFFAMTFLGSIAWIAVFSYLMVWWAHQVGETIGISEEIMGLTILAAGTSIPDLITSVIVARKGLGDMAVSSSVGSNIFDITVGLPVPWLMYSSFHGFAPVQVSSNGLFCAIVLLFLMLLFVIISIAVCKWKMNKMLGSTMFLLYFVFLVLSVMLEDRIIMCPVSI
ncbi:sodium/potassium/calcium exchanger 1 [Osmerus mordax]|uniref:sodium/potassium/calcium exchanger 1 n=1 Tax=Osmerus mordax TaxID=8014 RepID=UPI00350FBE6C